MIKQCHDRFVKNEANIFFNFKQDTFKQYNTKFDAK